MSKTYWIIATRADSVVEDRICADVLVYRVIHKSLQDFRTRLRNNQDRHGRKDHINR